MPLRSSDGDGGEGLALPRRQPPHRRHHPGDDGLLARQVGGELGRLVRDPLGEPARRLAERVGGDVGAEQLALPRPDLALGVRTGFDGCLS